MCALKAFSAARASCHSAPFHIVETHKIFAFSDGECDNRQLCLQAAAAAAAAYAASIRTMLLTLSHHGAAVPLACGFPILPQ